MKRAFVRALWGFEDDSNPIFAHRRKTVQNLSDIKQNQYNEPFITYVFGKDNLKLLNNNGFTDCVLLTEESFAYPLLKQQYRHKLEIVRYAMEEDGYDEIVHLDWDCIPQKKIPIDFWDTLGKKEIFQACLQKYVREKCPWREINKNVVPNGGFIYLRGRDVASGIIKEWENLGSAMSAEPAMAKYTDSLMGGWKGIDEYCKRFEVNFCNLLRYSAYSRRSKQYIKNKDICFIHGASK